MLLLWKSQRFVHDCFWTFGPLQPDFAFFLCLVCYLLFYDYNNKQKFSSALPVFPDSYEHFLALFLIRMLNCGVFL